MITFYVKLLSEKFQPWNEVLRKFCNLTGVGSGMSALVLNFKFLYKYELSFTYCCQLPLVKLQNCPKLELAKLCKVLKFVVFMSNFKYQTRLLFEARNVLMALLRLLMTRGNGNGQCFHHIALGLL